MLKLQNLIPDMGTGAIMLVKPGGGPIGEGNPGCPPINWGAGEKWGGGAPIPGGGPDICCPRPASCGPRPASWKLPAI